jgi:hypothetical protein
MNTKLLALVSALAATTVLASTAEAGGGVRLGFGFPLGAFTATPTHGGGGGGGAAAAPRHKQAKRTAPAASVQQAARKPDKAAPATSESEDKSDTASEGTGSPPLTGSSALIQQPASVDSGDTAAQPASTAPDVKAEAPASDASSGSVAAVDKGPSDTDAAGTCKKYVPAIGTTVSVSCGE